MSNMRIGVVMAGGSGERFWPLSRPERPKQLLRLTNPDATMLEEAVDRIRPLYGDEVFVATSLPLREPVVASGVVSEDRVLTEPARRNTLGAQCWLIASLLARGYQDATLAILTADHLIGEPEKFRACLDSAMTAAEEAGGIVTIGVPPDRPETGYGYIEEDASVTRQVGERKVARSHAFREKPSPETAEEFLSAGNFLWNSGMFFYTLRGFLAELLQAQPDAHEATMETAVALGRGDHSAAVKAFERLPNLSVDYAVMEHAQHVYVIRADFPWDDVGAWDAISRSFPLDTDGNVVHGDAVLLESHGCVVVNESQEAIVGAIGLKDVVVVMAKDAVLVCPKEQAQRVRLIAQAISKR
jgi:mannose-1-phosphate guanylyltransferase